MEQIQTLTGKDLIEVGIKPGPKFPQILKECNALLTKEEALAHARTFIVKPKEQPKEQAEMKIWPWNCAFGFIRDLPFKPDSTENRHQEASNSEIRRWLESGSIVINGKRLKPEDIVEFPIWQLVFHPGGNKRCTMQGCAVPCKMCKGECCCLKGHDDNPT